MKQRPQVVFVRYNRATNAVREVVAVALPKPDLSAFGAGNKSVFSVHPVNLCGGFVQLLGNRFTTGRTIAQQSGASPQVFRVHFSSFFQLTAAVLTIACSRRP
jgi:hypothetical protein